MSENKDYVMIPKKDYRAMLACTSVATVCFLLILIMKLMGEV